MNDIFAQRKVIKIITNMVMRRIYKLVDFKQTYYNVDIKNL